mgnify:CR=1 FL=1
MNSHLQKLENESIYIFRQAYRSIKNIGMLWSLGKDSNVMVWLAFKAFLGKIPFHSAIAKNCDAGTPELIHNHSGLNKIYLEISESLTVGPSTICMSFELRVTKVVRK